MKSYPKYKPTNIDWIKEMPSHWDNTIVKRITKRHKQGYYSTDDYIDNGVKLIRITDLNSKGDITYEKCPSVVVNEKDEEIFALNEGDFLFPRTGSIGSFGFVQKPERSVFASYLISFTFKENLVRSKFLKFYFTSNFYLDGLFSDLHGGVNQNIHAENIKDRNIFLPPLPEQQAIVTFLDQKTALIDELIAKKERKIELLKENRTALINHAVTKGLDPTVKYKDSGIEWLGEIPEHWVLVKVGHLTRIIRGASPRPAGDPLLFDGDFINWITVGSVTNSVGKYVWETETFLTEAGMVQSRVVEPETLLISNSGATLGVPKILKIKGCINDGSVAFLDLKPNLERDFLYYFLVSQTDLLREQQSGYGQPNLNTDIIANIRFPLPSTVEQKEVVEFLDSNLEIYDQNISLELQKIEKLKEYRQSLISNVVTGKICVLED